MAQQDSKVEERVSQKACDKLIVITGASSGIGQECVKPFLKEGHPILMLARNVENMEKGKKEICELLSKELNKKTSELESLLYIKKCNVILSEKSKDGKTHSISSAIEECVTELNKANGNASAYVDCIINNAGIMLLEQLETQGLDKINTMLTVNINGVINGLKAVITGMKTRKQGTIINISSMAGKKHFDNHTVYCATKFAVQALTEGLRQELANYNVRVSVICPGAVETNLLSHNTDDVIKGYSGWKDTMTLGVLMPVDVSNACHFVYKAHPRCCVREIQLAPVNQVP